MKKISTLGIDLAKNVFQLHGVDSLGKTVIRKSVRRSQLIEFIAKLPVCLIGMEACSGSSYWARKFNKMGHTAKLMSPQFVKPYVKSNKNDRNDAEAICEAVARPNMRFVSIKQIWQQDIQCLHRVRQRLIKNRTALVNEIRGLLNEYGIIIPMNIQNIAKHLPFILEDASNELTELSRDIFQKLYEEYKIINERVEDYDLKIKEISESNEICCRLQKIEGVGPLTSTAIISAVGDAKVFKNGRQMAAWLGLVPRQNSSGGKSVLLGISKRGDTYLRSLLVHGARSTVRYAKNKTDSRSHWIKEKETTRGYNKATVAVANKNARIIWALMVNGSQYWTAA